VGRRIRDRRIRGSTLTVEDLSTPPARASGEFVIGGDLPDLRLGFGTMQLPGPGVWSEPRDHNEAIRVLRRAVELGVTLIDR
jgi:pyridoxine 4-dehydrogenase